MLLLTPSLLKTVVLFGDTSFTSFYFAWLTQTFAKSRKSWSDLTIGRFHGVYSPTLLVSGTTLIVPNQIMSRQLRDGERRAENLKDT